jgi:peptide/nickel transport system substrate-binding protein
MASEFNVDVPTMKAWKITQYEEGDALMVAERNPYYYRVDAEGNQLPYIDQVYFHLVEDVAGLNAMGISGDLDMQARAIDLAQYPIYQENAEANDYHMLLWPNAQASSLTLWFNMSFSDPNYRALFQNLDFRKAMSHAIDRDTLNQVSFLGQGVPRTITVVPESPYYVPELENLNGEYDPELATSLLGGLGLVWRQ